MEVLLVQEGIRNLQLLQFTVVQDCVLGMKFALPPALNEVVRLLYLLSGLKFSSAPVRNPFFALVGDDHVRCPPELTINTQAIAGNVSTANTFTSPFHEITTPSSNTGLSSDFTSLHVYGARRGPSLQLLSDKIWTAISRIVANTSHSTTSSHASTPSSPSISRTFPTETQVLETTLAVAAIRLAAKICPQPRDYASAWKRREVITWGAERGTSLMRELGSGTSFGALPDAGLRLGVRENATPLRASAGVLAVLEVFENNSQAVSLLVWNGLLGPAEDAACHVIRPLTSRTALHPSIFFSTLDRILEYYDHVISLILTDPRRASSLSSGEGDAGAVWQALRTLITAESCMAEKGLLALQFYRLRQVEVMDEEKRTRRLLAIPVGRLATVLAFDRPLPELYHLLEVLLRNVELVGPNFLSLFKTFAPLDQQRLRRALHFGGFWDEQAARKVADLDSLFENLSLEEDHVSRHLVAETLKSLS
ncbi:hypothetical protein MNV49_001766 [Pseudohyphozyma bogoriensis]|nr:hypothetical protein MNV49_001766 [Pseudohyphozyma bogoriensis]